MTDDTTLKIVFDDAGGASGPAAAPAPVPPPDQRFRPADPGRRPDDGRPGDTKASREADRLGLLLGDVAARVNRGLLTLAEGLDRADRLGRGDAGVDYARDRGYQQFGDLAREVLAKSAAPPGPAQAATPAPFDFTPKGGVPFDFAPGAKSPGSEKAAVPRPAFDFAPPKPLPTAARLSEPPPPAVAERIEPPPPAPPGVADWLAKAGRHLPGPLGRAAQVLPDVAKGFGRPAEFPTAPFAVGDAPTGRAAEIERAGGANVLKGGQAAEAAAGAGAGLAAVGGALAGAAATAYVLKTGFEAARESVQFFGAEARRVASNDGIGLLSDAADAAAGGLEKIPIAGKMLAAELQAVVEPLRQIDQTARAFVARGRELAAYDGRLAVAAAEADVRKLMGDVREARRTGDAQARLIGSQSRFDESIQTALTVPKREIAEGLSKVLDKLTVLIEVQTPMIEAVTNQIVGLLTIIEEAVSAVPAVAEYMKAIKEYQEVMAEKARLEKRGEGIEAMRQLSDAARQLGLRPVAPAAQEAERQQGQMLGIPLLSRR